MFSVVGLNRLQVHRKWEMSVEDGTARDSTGHFPMGELRGNAKIADGKLIHDGAQSYVLVSAAVKPDVEPSAGGDSRKGQNSRGYPTR